ncbi:hypothetical protein ID0469_14920 [Helicobacter pylori]
MGMGLYGGEKIKWLTREGERRRIFKNNNHYKFLSLVSIIFNFDTLSRFFLLIKNSFFLSF